MEWEAVLVNFQEFDEVVILQAPRPVRTIREYRNVQQMELLDDFVYGLFEQLLDSPPPPKVI